MTLLENNSESIFDYLNSLSDSELVGLWNTYCQENSYPDDEIYSNDEEFFELFYSDNVIKAVMDTDGDQYSYSDDYVVFTIYGLRSSDDVKEFMDLSALTDAILKDSATYDIELEEEDEEE